MYYLSDTRSCVLSNLIFVETTLPDVTLIHILKTRYVVRSIGLGQTVRTSKQFGQTVRLVLYELVRPSWNSDTEILYRSVQLVENDVINVNKRM